MLLTLPTLAALLIALQVPADDGVLVPADPPARWWKGNLHTHSLWSDGNDYPEMIVDWYRRRGYHFLRSRIITSWAAAPAGSAWPRPTVAPGATATPATASAGATPGSRPGPSTATSRSGSGRSTSTGPSSRRPAGSW